MSSPAPGLIVPAGLLEVSGSIVELLSGVAVTCNGTTGQVTDDTFECAVTVPTGTSTIVIIATDDAGNESTRQLSVTTSNAIGAEPTSLRITPQNVTLAIGDKRRFRVVDNLGRVPGDAVWNIDAPTYATLTTANGIVVEGVAGGEVLLTATWRGLTATAEVTVLSGTEYVSGSTLWSSPPLAGEVKDIVRGASAPDGTQLLFAAESAGESGVLRAFDRDGGEVWARTFNGRGLHHPARLWTNLQLLFLGV